MSADFRTQIQDLYGIKIERVEPGPRGFTGVTSSLSLQGGRKAFAKVYASDRTPVTVLPALPALVELHDLGVGRISRPLASASGALHEPIDGGFVILFDHIDGSSTGSFDRRALGDLIGEIHALRNWRTRIESESFTPGFALDFWPTLERARSTSAGEDPLRDGLRAHLREIWSDLERDWRRFMVAAQRCRDSNLEAVVTHGDVPFNVMTPGDGTVFLVDWDEMLVAPPERDIWFFTGDREFLAGYRTRRPLFEERAIATDYYARHRYLEELFAFSISIMGNESSDVRKRALSLVRGEWMNGLRGRQVSEVPE